MKKNIIIIITVIIITVGISYGLYYFENYEDTCYTKIDNEKKEKLSTNEDMLYEYSLTCYKENGKSKQIKFKTNRELKQDAYLLIDIRITGVHSWEEVSYEDLPNKVKNNYQ